MFGRTAFEARTLRTTYTVARRCALDRPNEDTQKQTSLFSNRSSLNDFVFDALRSCVVGLGAGQTLRTCGESSSINLGAPEISDLRERHRQAKIYSGLRRYRSELAIQHPLARYKEAHRGQTAAHKRAADSQA
jgi:hypothetical protein